MMHHVKFATIQLTFTSYILYADNYAASDSQTMLIDMLPFSD